MLSPRGKLYIGSFFVLLGMSLGYVWLAGRPSADSLPQSDFRLLGSGASDFHLLSPVPTPLPTTVALAPESDPVIAKQVTIVDSVSNKDLSGAKVRLTQTIKIGKKTKKTSLSGDVELLRKEQPAGTYSAITITATGYTTKTLSSIKLAAPGPLVTTSIQLVKKSSKT